MSEPQVQPRLWRTLRDHPLVRRVIVVGVIALGLLVLMPLYPHKIDLSYDLGRAHQGLSGLVIEVHDSRGRLVRRTEIPGDREAAHPVEHLRLTKGVYRAALTLQYPDRVEYRERAFEVTGSEDIDLNVEQP